MSNEVDLFDNYVNKNKDLILSVLESERKKRKVEKTELVSLNEGSNKVYFRRLVKEPVEHEHSFKGNKDVKWYYNYEGNKALVVRDSVHWRIVDVKLRFPKCIGVEIIGRGKGNNRRYTEFLPIYEHTFTENDRDIEHVW